MSSSGQKAQASNTNALPPPPSLVAGVSVVPDGTVIPTVVVKTAPAVSNSPSATGRSAPKRAVKAPRVKGKAKQQIPCRDGAACTRQQGDVVHCEKFSHPAMNSEKTVTSVSTSTITSLPVITPPTKYELLTQLKHVPYLSPDKVVVNALRDLGIKAQWHENAIMHPHGMDAAIRHVLLNEALSYPGALEQKWKFIGASHREIVGVSKVFLPGQYTYCFEEGVAEDLGKHPNLFSTSPGAMASIVNEDEDIGPVNHICMTNMYKVDVHTDQPITPEYLVKLIKANDRPGERPTVLHWIGHIHKGIAGSSGSGWWIQENDLIRQYPDNFSPHYSEHESMGWLLDSTGVKVNVDGEDVWLYWKLFKNFNTMTYVTFTVSYTHFKLETKVPNQAFVQVEKLTLPVLPHLSGMARNLQYVQYWARSWFSQEATDMIKEISGHVYYPLFRYLKRFIAGRGATPYVDAMLHTKAKEYSARDCIEVRALNLLMANFDPKIQEFTVSYTLYHQLHERMVTHTRLSLQSSIAGSRLQKALHSRPEVLESSPYKVLFYLAGGLALVIIVKKLLAKAYLPHASLAHVLEVYQKWAASNPTAQSIIANVLFPFLEECMARIPRIGKILKLFYAILEFKLWSATYEAPPLVKCIEGIRHVSIHMACAQAPTLQRAVASHYLYNWFVDLVHGLKGSAQQWGIAASFAVPFVLHGLNYLSFGKYLEADHLAKLMATDCIDWLHTPHLPYPHTEHIGRHSMYSLTDTEISPSLGVSHVTVPFVPNAPVAPNLQVSSDVPEYDNIDAKLKWYLLYGVNVPLVAFDNTPTMLEHALNVRVLRGHPLIQSDEDEERISRNWNKSYAPWSIGVPIPWPIPEFLNEQYRDYIRDKPSVFRSRIKHELSRIEEDVITEAKITVVPAMVKKDEIHLKFVEENGEIMVSAKPRIIANVHPHVTAFCGPAIVYAKKYLSNFLSHEYLADVKSRLYTTTNSVGKITRDYKCTYREEKAISMAKDRCQRPYFEITPLPGHTEMLSVNKNGTYYEEYTGSIAYEETRDFIPITFKVMIASEYTMEQMCEALSDFMANMRAYFVLIWVLGDDKLWFFHDHTGKLHVGEEDYSMYDITQSRMAHMVEYHTRHSMGTPANVTSALYSLAEAPYVGTDIKVSFKSTIQRKSGGPNTSDGNSIVTAHSTFIVLVPMIEDMIRGDPIYTCEQFTQAYAKLGLVVKIRYWNTPFFGPTFLKGILVQSTIKDFMIDADDMEWYDRQAITWVRVPSVSLIKSCKAMTNPVEIYKGTPPQARARMLHDILNSQEGAKDPLSAAFYARVRELAFPLRNLNIKDFHLYKKHVIRPYKDGTGFSSTNFKLDHDWYTWYLERYNMDTYEVDSLLSLLQAFQIGDFMFHPAFLKLAKADYC